MEVWIVKTEIQMQDVFKVRKVVFVEEQNVPIDEEIDQFEEEATHFIAYSDEGIPIGAGRFRTIDDFGKVERICVLSDFRNKGIGQLIMNRIIDFAKEKQFLKIKLNSQTHAIPFYERLGFRIISDEFMDAGIPHRTMELNLN